jgi:predicted transport protein/ABC-type cobalamin/Fe3+-siderophores transport system ATPase subunit
MKIKKLIIKNYKNLDAELIHDSDIIAFIGNNGSGKSNLLEAISHIFRSLYKLAYKADFDYFIEYVTSKNQNIKIEKKGAKKNYHLDNKIIIDVLPYLPQKVVAIYSGEEGRLFDDCFGPFYFEFIRGINKASLQGTEYSDLPQMLYLNKFFWHISLLSLLVSDSEDNKLFVKDVLKIDKVDKIKFDFINKNYGEYNDNLALKLVRDIDSKAEYELEEFKELLTAKGYTADDLYKFLYLAFMPRGSKIIEDIIIKFNANLTITDFSEGEKKLLLIKAALEFAGQEDSVFILDEPDAHIHINNKEQITKSFEQYLHNRQIIITTHSPTLTQCVKDENVYMLNSGKIENKTRQEIIQEVTGDFWNKHLQNSFLSTNKPIVLFVEGKHDKEHINNAYTKLKAEYSDLQFDIFYMNSACNIPPMMTGLRTSELNYNKLFIAIFDNDPTGKVELSNTACKYPEIQNVKRHKEGYYSFLYPKHTDHKSEFFTVENFFEAPHLETAYNAALTDLAGKFKGKSIASINDDIKDKAKSKLFDNSKALTSVEDFKHFRNLFNVIREINTNYQQLKIVVKAKVTKSEKLKSPTISLPANTAIVSTKAKKTFTVDNHTKGKSEEIIALYESFKDAIIKLDKSITISPMKDYIAFKKGKNVVDINIQQKALKLWINLNKGELKDPKKITTDVSKKGHWGNGDYAITIKDNNNISDVLDLIKQAIK